MSFMGGMLYGVIKVASALERLIALQRKQHEILHDQSKILEHQSDTLEAIRSRMYEIYVSIRRD